MMSISMTHDNPVRVKSRVIGALVLRESKVTFGAAQMGYLWAVLEPVLGTAIIAVLFSYISHHPPLGTSFALFFATGILSYQFYQKLSNSLMAVFEANRGLLAYPLVTETDVVFGRYILISFTYLFVYSVFLGGLVVFWNVGMPQRLDVVLAAMTAISLLGLGAGLLNAIIYMLWPTWRRIEAILTRPLFFLSGVFFIPGAFPPDIRNILAWNPLLQAIDWLRVGYYPNYDSPTLDVGYLWMYVGILVFLAFSAERLYRKHQK